MLSIHVHIVEQNLHYQTMDCTRAKETQTPDSYNGGIDIANRLAIFTSELRMVKFLLEENEQHYFHLRRTVMESKADIHKVCNHAL